MNSLTEDLKKLTISTINIKYKVKEIRSLAIKKGINPKQTKLKIIKELKKAKQSPIKQEQKPPTKRIKELKKKQEETKEKRKKEKRKLLQESKPLKGEIWKHVKQFESNRITATLEVSNYGRVKRTNHKGKVKLNYGNKSKEEMRVLLKINGKYTSLGVHSLVIELFGPPKPKNVNIQIEHLDGNNMNNKLNNLIWSTFSNVGITANQPKQHKVFDKKTGIITIIKNKLFTSFRYRFTINRKRRTKTFRTMKLAEAAKKEYIKKIVDIESGVLPISSLSFL